ncbi:MAG: hypothetical protein ABIV94_08095, partial [Acidimicrobiales bacterium]
MGALIAVLSMVAGTALASVVVAPPALALSGGPDNFGYTFTDSTEVGGPAFDFQDISATGTDVGTAAFCDDCLEPVPLPFTFSFYGNAQNDVFVSSNGFLSFANDYDGCCSGDLIPTAGPPDNFIAGFWTDLGPAGDTTGGTIKSETLGTSPNRIFVVQFTDIPEFPDGPGLTTMQFKLFEGSNNIEVHYLTASAENHLVTAGIENAPGTDGLQYLNADNPTLSNIAVRYTYPPPDVTAPTCVISARRAGPPKELDVTVQDTG